MFAIAMMGRVDGLRQWDLLYARYGPPPAHLVNEVVPDAEVFARAREVAELIAAIPPAPLRAEKLGLLHQRDVPYESAAFIASTFRALAAQDGR